jgi:hypothetical protein
MVSPAGVEPATYRLAQARRVYKNLSEELFEMSQEPAFKFDISDGVIELWNDQVGGY